MVKKDLEFFLCFFFFNKKKQNKVKMKKNYKKMVVRSARATKFIYILLTDG